MENGTISAIFLGDNGDLTFYFYSRSKSLSVQERRLKMSRMCQKRNEKRFLLVNTPMQIPLIALARMIRGMQQTCCCKCNLQDICLVCQQSKIEFSYKAYKPKLCFGFTSLPTCNISNESLYVSRENTNKDRYLYSVLKPIGKHLESA